MKNILFLTTTPTVGGNGDALISAAMETAKKQVGIFLTCTGSEPEEMKRHVRNILTLPSVSRAISEYRTEVFTQCVSDSTCHDRADYLDRAKEIARWAAGA